MQANRIFFKLILLCALSIGCLLGSTPKSAHGGVMLSLQAQGAVDLSNLSIGQAFTVEVVLSGLQGEELNYLAGTVNFDANLLGSASNVAASLTADGGIVPILDGYFGFGMAGLADGLYDVGIPPSFPRITTNGALYSFTVTAQQAGSGVFEFSSLAARNPMDAEVLIDAGLPLAYTINNAPNVIPEPASCVVFGILCLVSGLSRWSRSGLKKSEP